jgi:hypothetical protein
MYRIVLAALVTLGLAETTPASITLYTTSGAFNTAVGSGPITVQDFNSVPVTSEPIPAGGFTITGGYSVYNGDATYGTGLSINWYTANPGSVVFTFSSPITAFGADFFDVGTNGATTLTAALNNGAGSVNLFNNFIGATGNQQFRGLISMIPFTTITFTNTQEGDIIELDNARFGTAGAPTTPEPASMAVFGLAAVGGLALRRRKAKAG